MATETESAERTDSQQQPQSSGLGRWTPTLPTNIVGMLNPFSTDDTNKTPELESPATNSSDQSKKRTSIFASIFPSTSTPAAPSPSKEDNQDVMFAEPDTRSNSEFGSHADSDDDSGRRKSKTSNKPRTRYSICHPPPASTTRQRLHRRPRSLLQLHKLSSTARPVPAYDVIPSANFSLRLTKAITKVFRAEHGLCRKDLVILKAENYSNEEADEEQEARDSVALICNGRKEEANSGKVKICLPNGREWEAYITPNGTYEFFNTDEHGLGQTLRWVPKKNKDGSKPRKKFNFSTISPNSRRHPVIATLSKTGLYINDTYKVPDQSGSTPLGTPQQSGSVLSAAMEEESGGNEQCVTDDYLREIITVTGIWVTFREGWSPNFKYEDREGLSRTSSLSVSPNKAATFATSPVSTPPGSPGSPGMQKRNSFGSGIVRSRSLLGKSNRNSMASIPDMDEDVHAAPEAGKKTGRARADSASTVLVHRAASNRVKQSNQAAWRPDMLREMSEPPSIENLARSDSEVSPPSRRESVAQPILPSASEEEEPRTNGTASTRRASGRESPDKRESSATTSSKTSGASEPARKPPPAKTQKKKRGGLRRLLCGGGQN